jgi:hypothetical protein
MLFRLCGNKRLVEALNEIEKKQRTGIVWREIFTLVT